MKTFKEAHAKDNVKQKDIGPNTKAVIKGAKTSFLKTLHRHNFGQSGGGEHHFTPHVEAELKSRGLKLDKNGYMTEDTIPPFKQFIEENAFNWKSTKSEIDHTMETHEAAYKADGNKVGKKSKDLIKNTKTSHLKSLHKWNYGYASTHPLTTHVETELASRGLRKTKNGLMTEDTIPSFKQFIEENAFNWKSTKSEIDWKNLDKDSPAKVATSTGGTVYKARETERDAETGGKKITPKQSVGRPTGEYGSYKIDKAKRDDPKYKAELAAKVRAAKADGFAARDEFKKGMDAALRKRQLELAGLDK
jgi:hypothetical protein